MSQPQFGRGQLAARIIRKGEDIPLQQDLSIVEAPLLQRSFDQEYGLGVGRLGTLLAGFAVSGAVVVWLASLEVAFFYWCPLSGLAMVFTVWALERTRPEWAGIG